jgi:ABC-type amino acid transport substrate-binding protein
MKIFLTIIFLIQGDVSSGASYGVASTDIPLLGVSKGDYYGLNIDLAKMITAEMANLIAIPLEAEFVKCADHVDGWFFSLYQCLLERECDITVPELYRLPYREALVDYTCPSYDSVTFSVYSLSATPSIESSFTGSICVGTGTGQELAAMNNYPNAQFNSFSSMADAWSSFCAGGCDYIVDDPTNGNSCTNELYSADLPLSSPAGDVGAVTYKLIQVSVDDVSSASVVTVGASLLTLLVAHLF